MEYSLLTFNAFGDATTEKIDTAFGCSACARPRLLFGVDIGNVVEDRDLDFAAQRFLDI